MRELSAKLTEGETLHSQINIFAYTTKIAVNIQIANSHYPRLCSWVALAPVKHHFVYTSVDYR